MIVVGRLHRRWLDQLTGEREQMLLLGILSVTTERIHAAGAGFAVETMKMMRAIKAADSWTDSSKRMRTFRRQLERFHYPRSETKNMFVFLNHSLIRLDFAVRIESKTFEKFMFSF